MDKEISKIIKQKQKPHNFKKWWSENGYKVLRIVCFPVWFTYLAIQKINKKLDSLQEWDEERANKLLKYYIPRQAEWYEDDQFLCISLNSIDYYNKCNKKFIKRKNRRFWDKYLCTLRDYAKKSFELEGFEKTVAFPCNDSYYENLYFKLIDKKA